MAMFATFIMREDEKGAMVHPNFVERMKELGLDMSLYENLPRKSVYVMRNEELIVNEFTLERVSWADHVFWVDEPKKVEDKYYASVFVQDAASVVPVLVLDVNASHVAVDLCAAPGSKTLHLSQRARAVIANDVNRNRIKRLNHNIVRFGVENCVITCKDGRSLRLREKVDRVLVDAPCMGEGMVGKFHKMMKLWSEKRMKALSRVQKKLVLNGLSLLKEGGVLVYSTCTFSPEENEDVVGYVLKKGGVELDEISIKNMQYIPGLTRWKERMYDPVVERTVRIYPFHNGTNGFFVAKFRKL